MHRFAHYKDVPDGFWRWPDFSPREIASKREGELGVDEEAMDKLQALRARLGRPIILTSAYRSAAHNRAVGGARNSYHMQGRAFDVRMDNQDPVAFADAARAVGFTGFGHYVRQGFMHIDTRAEPLTFKGKVSDWPATATGVAAEPRHPPEKLRQDPEAIAAGGAAAASGTAVAIEELPAVTRVLGDLAPTAQTIAVVATVVLVGWLFWRKTRK